MPKVNGYITLEKVSKSYNISSNLKHYIFENIDLQIEQREFTTIIGQNGTGKTTLLKIIGGLISPDSGSVFVAGLKPEEALKKGKIGYIPQNYAASLFEWRTNFDNIAFPLEIKNIHKKERYKKVLDIIEKFDLGISQEMLQRYPYELSAGEKQKVVLARTLIYEPEILLMDEPFSNLDIVTRPKLQNILLDVWRRGDFTIIFVSHDIKEAIYLGNQIILLKKDVKSKFTIYNNPISSQERQEKPFSLQKLISELEKEIEK